MREPKVIEVEGWAVVQALKGAKPRHRWEKLLAWGIFAVSGFSVWMTGGLHIAIHGVCALLGVRCPF